MFKNIIFIAVLAGAFGFAIGSPAAKPVAQAPGPSDFITDVLEIIALAEALNGTTNGATSSISTTLPL